MIEGFALSARDEASLATFYCHALAFRPVAAAFGGIGLALGDQTIALFAAAPKAADYPAARASNDPWFQHLAIVVSDIGAAFRHAMDNGAVAISRGGPQVLPASSGGVTAWKFRDPEGHPLELLEFPPDHCPAYWQERLSNGLFVGIDHSAIVVRNTARSEAFYAGFGFRRTAQSHNHGPAQSALDGLDEPDVVVTALTLDGQDAPHLELLDYRAPAEGAADATWSGLDVVASRLVLSGQNASLQRDPTGHFVSIQSPSMRVGS